MTFIYKTNIEKLAKKYIHGNIARIGGSVDQIHLDKNTSVQDINILDGGFGSTKSIAQGADFSEYAKIINRKVKQEIKHFFLGNKIPLDRKTIQLDLHFAGQERGLVRSYDATISSNVIEHSPNAIFFLLNFYLITKEDGWQFHALPNHKYTYDRYRIPTTLDHFIRDFECRQSFSDDGHRADYIQSAIEKDGWQKNFHKKYPVSYPYMHFHVFDEVNTLDLFNFIFEDVTVDVIRNERFSDNVVLCKNKLNMNFLEKYSHIIEEVKNGKYLSRDL